MIFLSNRMFWPLNETPLWQVSFKHPNILVEQNLTKCRLVKAEPLPISNIKNDCMNDMASC